jgi:glucan 1,3-beta-glucosidase
MLISLFLASLLATLSLARSHRSLHSARFSPGFPYGSEKVRGVNLGGWLVLEVCCYPSPPLWPCVLNFLATVTQRWITPSLFDGLTNPAIIDEWTFAEFQDRDVAHAKLLAHWSTFITEADFKAIANAGCVFCSAGTVPLPLSQCNLVL